NNRIEYVRRWRININIYKLTKFICVITIYYYIIAKLTVSLADNYIILRGIIFGIASIVFGKAYKYR
ncbi:hypothetical protein, partial [uncultured Clostridium sp.]